MEFADLLLKLKHKAILYTGLEPSEIKINIEVSSRSYSAIHFCISKWAYDRRDSFSEIQPNVNIEDFEFLGFKISIKRNYDL